MSPLVFGWAPNHFVLEAQLAPGEKRLVCIPVTWFNSRPWLHYDEAKDRMLGLPVKPASLTGVLIEKTLD